MSVSRTNNKNNTISSSSSSNATPRASNEAECKPFDDGSFKQIFLQDAMTRERVTSEKLPNRGGTTDHGLVREVRRPRARKELHVAADGNDRSVPSQRRQTTRSGNDDARRIRLKNIRLFVERAFVASRRPGQGADEVSLASQYGSHQAAVDSSPPGGSVRRSVDRCRGSRIGKNASRYPLAGGRRRDATSSTRERPPACGVGVGSSMPAAAAAPDDRAPVRR